MANQFRVEAFYRIACFDILIPFTRMAKLRLVKVAVKINSELFFGLCLALGNCELVFRAADGVSLFALGPLTPTSRAPLEDIRGNGTI